MEEIKVSDYIDWAGSREEAIEIAKLVKDSTVFNFSDIKFIGAGFADEMIVQLPQKKN